MYNPCQVTSLTRVKDILFSLYGRVVLPCFRTDSECVVMPSNSEIFDAHAPTEKGNIVLAARILWG